MARKAIWLVAGVMLVVCVILLLVEIFFGIETFIPVKTLKEPPDLESDFFQPGELGAITVSPVTRTIPTKGIARYNQTLSAGSGESATISIDVSLWSPPRPYDGHIDPVDSTYIPNLGDKQGLRMDWMEVFQGVTQYRFTRCGALLSVSLPRTFHALDAEKVAFQLDAKMKDVLCRYRYPSGTPLPE